MHEDRRFEGQAGAQIGRHLLDFVAGVAKDQRLARGAPRERRR